MFKNLKEKLIRTLIKKSLVNRYVDIIDEETKKQALSVVEDPSSLTENDKVKYYKQYYEEHMDEINRTEKEKMMAGLPYSPMIPDIIYENMVCGEFLDKFNATKSNDTLKRADMIKEFFKHTGKNVFIQSPFRCMRGYNISIGDDCFMNCDCIILDDNEVSIGKNCWFGPRCLLITGTHPTNYKERRNIKTCSMAKPIHIGNDCFFGAASIILPGVTIGNNVVVGAGSVVTKDVPSNTVVCGNPARPIKQLDPYVEDEKEE